jgi:hypothetical protein
MDAGFFAEVVERVPGTVAGDGDRELVGLLAPLLPRIRPSVPVMSGSEDRKRRSSPRSASQVTAAITHGTKLLCLGQSVQIGRAHV